jgi:hypothetical protein
MVQSGKLIYRSGYAIFDQKNYLVSSTPVERR